jgi:hypothetical protein
MRLKHQELNLFWTLKWLNWRHLKIHQALECLLEYIGDNYSRSKPLYRSTKQQDNENLNHE